MELSFNFFFMTSNFISLFPDIIGFETMYNTFGWWFKSPQIRPNEIIGYGKWNSPLEADTMHFWFLSQYGLWFYYSWLTSTAYQVLIARRPSYEEMLLRGVRLHNIGIAAHFLCVIHLFDHFYLGRGGHDFWYSLSIDIVTIRAFLIFQVLDMQFCMHATLLEIQACYIDRVKSFGTYDVRNTRAKYRQLRETVIFNTFFHIQPVICSLYCISPEIWDEDEVRLWVLSIYQLPYYNPRLYKGWWQELEIYGNMSDYSAEWSLPNCTRRRPKLMPWVTGERRLMFGGRRRRQL